MAEVTADKLADVYVKIRDKRAELKKQFEVEDEVLENKLKIIQQHLLEICKETGADSIKTKNGTVIRSVKTRYWTSDWSEMYAFILEHGAPELLEQRIAQGNIKTFLNDNPDLKPKGLNVNSEYVVTVRRA